MPKQPKQPTVERRYLTQEFRVSPDGEAPKIRGYAAVFNSPSADIGWTEIVDPHAFDAVMAGKHDCRALWNHNDDFVLGRESANTLHLSIDARGLAYVIDAPDTQLAKDLIVSMRRGDIRESSFSFITARDQWTEEADGTVTRRILEIAELIDASPVTYPAYPTASANARNLPATIPPEMRSKLMKTSKRSDDADPNDNGCQCDCDSCVSNDCTNCSDPDCNDPNCLANQDTESDSRSNKHKHSKRAFGQGCSCRCGQCLAGACGLCSADSCSDPECKSCGMQQRSKPISESERHRMQMELELLKLAK